MDVTGVVGAPSGVEVEWSTTDDGVGAVRVEWEVRNAGRRAVGIDRVGLRIDATAELVLEHGMQSWSPVRRCSPDDVRPERLDAPRWVRAYHWHEPSFAGAAVVGDQFLLTDGGVVGFVDARSHLGSVEARPAGGGGLVAWALLDGIELAPGASRRLDPLWLADGDPGRCYSAFAQRWGAEMGARIAADPPPVGWCSWYQWFAAVTPDVVRANLGPAVDHGIDLVQVDDGWQAAIGDWTSTSEAWGEPIDAIAADIAATGATAGLWTAPFLAAEGSRLAADHPDWFVRHPATGAPMRAMHNPAWGGWTWALDTTRPDVVDHLTATYAALRAAGFGYHKIDFCYAGSVPGGRAADGSRTRAEALRLGLDAVRAGIGDDAFLLGCGCPFGPAVGVVDAMRVSADVAPTWEPTAHWPGHEEAAPSARNAVMASVLRAPLHRRLWVNDPDCVLLRPTDTGLSSEQRQVLADVVAGAGAFTVVSDDLARYADDEWAELARLSGAASTAVDPLDLVDPFATPVVVGGASSTLTVDWDTPTSTLTAT